MGETFKRGDTVRLKSGGPDMVVEEFYAPTGVADCHWVTGHKVHRESYVVSLLEMASGKR